MATKGPLKKLYDRGPVWLQNAMVSGYGWQRHRQRYGGNWHDWVCYFAESERWSTKAFEAYQLRRLRQLVAHSMEYVPHFRDSYRAQGIVAEEITNVKQLPFLEKDTLRVELDRCIATRWPRKQLIEAHTSGSTGTPLTHFMQIDDFRERMALLERQRRWAGVQEGDRVVSFGGSLIIPRGKASGTLWRFNLPGRQMVVSSYHLTPENIPRIVDRMARFRPKFLEGYPSALYVVARWMEENGHPTTLQPQTILTTAETLHDYQRHTIEKVFCVHVHNYYGSSESAPLITECEEGSLHINPESGIFEFLRPDASDATPGEPAEMIVTSFATRAMPLIRYRIRDAAILDTDELCACGRHMPRVKSIIGRMDDMLYTRDRGWVGRLSQAVKVFPGSIREAQIIQYDIDSIIIRLVPDPELFEESHLEPLYEDLRNRLGNVVKLQIEYVSQIERGPNNKFKYVICALPAEEKQRLQLQTHPESVC